jgi:anti-sigma factor RsiW
MSDEANRHERWSEELAAYLLGGLDPSEAGAFERHAEGCERCRAETRWLAPAMQALPETVERLEPPRQLRERLMGEVRADAAAARGGAADGAARRGWRQRLAGIGRWAGDGPLGLRPLAGLAAAALVVAAIAGYEVGAGGSSGTGGSSGAGRTIVSGHAPGVVAEMVREGEGGSLHLANVSQLPEGKVLEAWVQRGGRVMPAPALFAPDRQGRASTTIADMRGVEAVMVTAEPSGGSKQPTTKPIVVLPIPS